MQPLTVPGAPLRQIGRVGGDYTPAERVAIDPRAGEGRKPGRQAIVIGVSMGDDEVAQVRQCVTVHSQSGFQRCQRLTRIGAGVH